jgi:hypothetical protein
MQSDRKIIPCILPDDVSETMAKQCVRVGISRNNVIFVDFFGGGKGSKKIYKATATFLGSVKVSILVLHSERTGTLCWILSMSFNLCGKNALFDIPNAHSTIF